MWPERVVSHARRVHSCSWSSDLQQKTVHPLFLCLVVTSSLTNSCICPLIIRVLHQCLLDVCAPFSSLMSCHVCWEVKSVWNVESWVCSGMLHACIAFRLCGVMSPCALNFGWGGTWNVNCQQPLVDRQSQFYKQAAHFVALHSWLLTSWSLFF